MTGDSIIDILLNRRSLSPSHPPPPFKMASYKELVEDLRFNFKSGITKSRDYRLNQLKNLMKMYEEGEDELIEALKEDLGKPATESLIFEIDFNKNFIKLAIASMDE